MRVSHFRRVIRKLGELLGYSEEELLDRAFDDISFPADRPEVRERMARVLGGDSGVFTQQQEKRYVRKDGSTLWVSIAVALVSDDRNKPQYFVTAIQDISERKRTEALSGLEHAVARILADADSAAATLKSVIRAVCESETWELGRYWRVDEPAGLLRWTEAWNVADAAVDKFVREERGIEERGGGGRDDRRRGARRWRQE